MLSGTRTDPYSIPEVGIPLAKCEATTPQVKETPSPGLFLGFNAVEEALTTPVSPHGHREWRSKRCFQEFAKGHILALGKEELWRLHRPGDQSRIGFSWTFCPSVK